MVEPIIGNSPNTISLISQIEQISKAEVNTLITGETGVGKELVVKHLYEKSKRNEKPFIKINCAALPDTLLESELFGYKKGAFTGADKEGKGKFELANGGVLFLDEIGDMEIGLQAKILHVLQDGYYTPIGSNECVKSDVWCLAATNRNIKEEIKSGNFREDLYYRLNTVELNIDPLRKRPEDIPHLLKYFQEKYSKDLKSTEPQELNDDLSARVNHYNWPGNVRELQNFVKRYILFGDKEVDLPYSESASVIDVNNKKMDFFEKPIDLNNINLKKMALKAKNREEKRIISYVLDQTHWNKRAAAKILKISYKTLLYKIVDCEIYPRKKDEKKIIGFPKSNIPDTSRNKPVRHIHI